jgi:predicted nucleic acid-binding protein
MLYPDTSVIISAVALEPETERVHLWLSENLASICISDWSITEFASAISGKMRAGALTEDQRAAGSTWFRAFVDGGVKVLPVSRLNFRRAASLMDATGSRLRAPDALHLAIAEEAGAMLVTFDTVQADEGALAGIATTTI